jgi:hypothetical protein
MVGGCVRTRLHGTKTGALGLIRSGYGGGAVRGGRGYSKQGITEGEDYRALITRLSTALAMTEAAYLEARRRCEI